MTDKIPLALLPGLLCDAAGRALSTQVAREHGGFIDDSVDGTGVIRHAEPRTRRLCQCAPHRGERIRAAQYGKHNGVVNHGVSSRSLCNVREHTVPYRYTPYPDRSRLFSSPDYRNVLSRTAIPHRPPPGYGRCLHSGHSEHFNHTEEAVCWISDLARPFF